LVLEKINVLVISLYACPNSPLIPVGSV